jgi:hypothetical protein
VFGMGTGVAPPAMPPGIESYRRPSGAGQPNPEILECNPAIASLRIERRDECNVVKPHGRLVPVS